MSGVDVAHLLLQLVGTNLLIDVFLGAIPCDEGVFAGAGLIVGISVVCGREGRWGWEP